MVNQRNTRQKQIIYDALCTLKHPSATEVYDYVHETYPTISRGTVFRVLASFAEEGRALKLNFLGSDTRYDAMTGRHFHARCRRCGAVKDVFSPALLSELDGVETDAFISDGCEVEFFGLCASCKSAEK
ncbi:MAG: transcriptional repressor [Clostridiales bacterium]|nr:transcriptional repressor [Clostridiales bacterium]